MSIEQEKVIDMLVPDESLKEVLLIITDHLPWSEPNYEHALALQNKINFYLSFIESGEIYEKFPEHKDKSVIIKVVGKYPLSKEAERFYEKARTTIQWAGFDLRFEPRLEE